MWHEGPASVPSRSWKGYWSRIKGTKCEVCPVRQAQEAPQVLVLTESGLSSSVSRVLWFWGRDPISAMDKARIKYE